jgi:hypothetical protein
MMTIILGSNLNLQHIHELKCNVNKIYIKYKLLLKAMNTFFLIIQQIIQTEAQDSNSPTIFFQIFLNTSYTTKLKFDFYNKTNKNLFLNDITKQRFNDLFCKIQRIYGAFNRLKRIFSYKYAKSNATTDMELNELVEGGKNVICLHHKNGKYLFKINDLLKIINNALTNSHYFFSEPIAVKNPYNNLPFDKSNLYNIYFFIKFNTCYKADLLEKYFKVDFNLSEFFQQYEFLLREHIIKIYLTDATNSHLHKHITNMINEFNKIHPTMRIKIDSEFPKDKLVTILRPYLTLYITSLYSLVTIIKSNAFAKLKYKLIKFYKFNPEFGRKSAVMNYVHIKMPACLNIPNPNVIVAKKMKPYIKKYVFNDKHENYFKPENDAFFENHKKIKNLYSVDYLRISTGQRTVTPNIFLIEDDSEDESSIEADTEDNDLDTEDDAADTISYEYNYEYNYTYN